MQEFQSSSISLCHAPSAFGSAHTCKENRQTDRYTDTTRPTWSAFCDFAAFAPYTWPAPVHCLPPSLFITRLIHQLSSAFNPSLQGCVAAIRLRQLATSEKNTTTLAEATYCLCGNVARCIQITDVKVKIKKLQFSFELAIVVAPVVAYDVILRSNSSWLAYSLRLWGARKFTTVQVCVEVCQMIFMFFKQPGLLAVISQTMACVKSPPLSFFCLSKSDV